MPLVLMGANHKSAPLEIRESLVFSQGDLTDTLLGLLDPPGLKEAMILSTCNRTEVIAHGEDVHRTIAKIKEVLIRRSGRPATEVEPHLYLMLDIDAVRHLFSVASSIDSMVVGEPQILGQVKEAYKLAVQCKACGPVLNRVLHHAFRVSKRVRTETEIGKGAVSVAYAAVEMARSIFKSLEGKTVLLVGAGEMIELAARHLMERGVKRLLVANRTLSRGQELAAQLRGTAVSFESLPFHLSQADMVLTCTGATDPIIHREQVRRALHARKNRPMFFIDIAVPRDVDPDVGKLDNVFLYDMQDLQRVVEHHKGQRESELKKALAIVDEAADKMAVWFGSEDTEPTIKCLRTWAEQVRQAELQKTLQRLQGLGERDQQMLDAMTKAIVNKLLHQPITHIRQKAGKEGSTAYLEMARELFGLDGAGR